MHRTTYSGLEHVPATNKPGGLIVVSNHTGPIDPLLIQAACRFEIRWMMAADMMIPKLEWLWRRHRMIPVARDGRDSGPVREAIRHVQQGGTIGVYPEGAIVQPRDEVRPFHDGVGLIIKRTRAPVLLVWITGTPESPRMEVALKTRSRSHVVFIDRLEFAQDTEPATITRILRERIVEASGWPVNDEPLIPPQRNGNPVVAA
jgi:1-acyl-sn-glycerol-3-phosphate acyltransferase